MKYKLMMLGIAMIAANSAFGDSMCIPQVASNQNYTYVQSTQVESNRGYWGLGTNCRKGTVSDDTDPDATERPVVCDNPIAYGRSHCSASGTYPASNWETNGLYCWCQLTHLRTSQADSSGNYIIAPKLGAWVFLQPDVHASHCAVNCAFYCANSARTWGGFRRALFASQGS